MKWKIEVSYKPETPDGIGQGICQDMADLGLTGVASVRTTQIYWIEGNINANGVERICAELLADPVTQDYAYSTSNRHASGRGNRASSSTDTWTIEVRFRLGVTDAVGDSVIKGVYDLGISDVQSAQTGQKYWIRGRLDLPKLEMIAQQLLANEVIQTVEIFDEH